MTPRIETHISGHQYAKVARVYHHELRANMRNPAYGRFWFVMYGWAQRCRREYQARLGKGQPEFNFNHVLGE